MVVKRLTYLQIKQARFWIVFHLFKSNYTILKCSHFYQIKCTFLKCFSLILSQVTKNCSKCSKLPNTEYCPNKLPSGQKLLQICTNNSLVHIFWSRLGSIRYWWAILRWNCYIFCYSKKSRLHGGFLFSSSEKATQDVKFIINAGCWGGLL